MTQFKYSETFTFKVPSVKIDKSALKKERVAAKTKLIKAHQAGMNAVEQSLGSALKGAMKSSWAWPRGGSRDIVETGRLMNSQRLVVKHSQTKSVLSVQYSSPYAALMYYGGMIQPYGDRNAASVLIPGRPWVEAVINGTHGQTKFDLASPYNAAFKNAYK